MQAGFMKEGLFLTVDFFLRKNTLYDPDSKGGSAMKAAPPESPGEEVNKFDRD